MSDFGKKCANNPVRALEIASEIGSAAAGRIQELLYQLLPI